MFKNASKIFLITMLICVGIFLGFFIGRISSGNMISVTKSENRSDSPLKNSSIDTKKLDLNTATVQELAEIPGVSKMIANSIIEYRENYGKFKTVYELKHITGISQALYETLLDYVTV